MKKRNVLLTAIIVGNLLFANILPATQPMSINAAPPSPATPTPTTPAEPTVTNQSSQTPPSPDDLLPEMEQARARQAIEAVLDKHLHYWGPRYQVAPVEVSVEGEWAHGVAQWRSEARTLNGPIHILAHRLPDGTWQALMPDTDGLYLQWVDAVPKSLVPDGEKSQLRTQAAEANALRRSWAAPAVPPAVTAMPPDKEGTSGPAEPIPEPLQPTAIQEQTGSIVHLLSDGQFVYGPNVADFNLAAYLKYSPTLHPLAQNLDDKASYYSINPRVLLTILEIRSRAVTASPPLTQEQMDRIAGYEDIVGYDDQLFELSKTLMESYYRRLYSAPLDEKATVVLTLNDGTMVHILTTTNAGTLAVLTALAPLSSPAQWQTLISKDDPGGFLQTYRRLFPQDDPLDDSNQVLAPQAPPASLLKFPFARNDTWRFSGGPHDNDGDCSGGDPYSAVDFAPGVEYCVIPGDRWIVSPAAGTVSDVSCGGCQVKINHQDGWGSYFYHVANPQVSNGQSVTQDQQIGNPSTMPSCPPNSCGGCPGAASGTHVHYALMHNGAFVAIEGTAFEGWVVHGTGCYDGYLEKDGQQKWVGSWVTSEGGGTCSAPSLNSPTDGYVHTSSDRTINFDWSPPPDCTPDGYTFRVSTSTNMDIVPGLPDRGEGGTSTSHTFDSQWDNTDLYWSVRACKPCDPYTPGPWASPRRFRIEPGSPPPATGNWNARYDQGSTCWWDPDCNMNPRCTETINGPELHKD
jgi:murein DD-endopeptidase MepM/ murein hydrolase activator NlpD